MTESRRTVHTEPSKAVVAMSTYRGKVVETDQAVEVRVPRRSKRKRGWRMHVAMLDLDIIIRLELTGSEHRVLFGLASHIPERGGTEARTSTTELAGELGISQQYVAKVLKDLKDRRIVRCQRQMVYEISPWLLYNGDFASWNMDAETWPEPVWRRDGADLATGVLS